MCYPVICRQFQTISLLLSLHHFWGIIVFRTHTQIPSLRKQENKYGGWHKELSKILFCDNIWLLITLHLTTYYFRLPDCNDASAVAHGRVVMANESAISKNSWHKEIGICAFTVLWTENLDNLEIQPFGNILLTNILSQIFK